MWPRKKRGDCATTPVSFFRPSVRPQSPSLFNGALLSLITNHVSARVLRHSSQDSTRSHYCRDRPTWILTGTDNRLRKTVAPSRQLVQSCQKRKKTTQEEQPRILAASQPLLRRNSIHPVSNLTLLIQVMANLISASVVVGCSKQLEEPIQRVAFEVSLPLHTSNRPCRWLRNLDAICHG